MYSSMSARASRCVTAALLSCAAFSACSGDGPLGGGDSAQAQRLRDSLLVSGPLAPSYAIARSRMSASRRASAAGVEQLAYISPLQER